jgi:hypothetical protein
MPDTPLFRVNSCDRIVEGDQQPLERVDRHEKKHRVTTLLLPMATKDGFSYIFVVSAVRLEEPAL